MNRRFSLLIVLCTIISVGMSSAISAKSNDLEQGKPDSLAAREKSHNQPEIVKEIIEGRGENYKRYLLRDGSYKLEIHESIIHYKDEHGEYQDLNTDLADGSTDTDVELLNDGIKKNGNFPGWITFEVTGNLTSHNVYNFSPVLIDAKGVTRNVKVTERVEGAKKYLDYEWDEEGLAYPVVMNSIVSLQANIPPTPDVSYTDATAALNQPASTSLAYIYDSAGRIDYILLVGKFKLVYEYDLNGNLIRTVKTAL
ncbi:hypothetical protein [Paenibacillus pinihumi]|uniref:hypothetical protein n=1 Tax=Paenibacillus pinihumi TaxID=669462 RepID=UPI0004106A3E|nr:hypothetical protein [Paenibacillus pinihumi]